MTKSNIYDYNEAGFRIFPLWGIINAKNCECGNPDCVSIGKHPRISNWQNTPQWSDEQLEVIIEHQVSTGFGVCLDNHLVLDIDPRNGGFESYEKLSKELSIDFVELSDFVVNTGGGGLHIYFNRPAGAYSGNLKEYRGIDFKTSGFVVGAGSLHFSGNEYETQKGFPQDLTDCPQALLDLLVKKTHTRAIINGAHVDVTPSEVQDIVNSIKNNDLHYDDFIQVGMGIHHATSGDGYSMWDNWAQQSSKYDPAMMSVKWHSFGKSANPVTLGTLIYLAEQNGYTRPVTFPLDEKPIFNKTIGELPFDTTIYDPKRPPGFVGKLSEWINGNSYSEPLEHLSVITSISAVGNIIGLHTTDDMTGVSTNLLVLCVAESASGKEMVQKSYAKIMQAAGISAAIAGGIKSKQEIARNLIEHQPVYYLIDEMGEVLRTIENAKKRGGAAYLEGVTGEVMSIYTKANSEYQVTGDVRRELVAQLRREKSQCDSIVDSNEDVNGKYLRRSESIADAIHAVLTSGLPRPFLSMIGYSVPASLDCIMTEEMAKNGFLSRALLAIEEKDNPKPRIGATGLQPLPLNYVSTLKQLSTTGNFDMLEDGDRIEYMGERRKIKTTASGQELLNELRMWEWEYAEHHRETSGFTPLIRRSFELISKISTILAAPEGLRTDEHIKWAAVYVKRDIDRKIRHILDAIAKTSKNGAEVQDGIEARILNLCQRAGGEKESILINRCKRKDISKEDIIALIDDMVTRGLLAVGSEFSKNGAAFSTYESLV